MSNFDALLISDLHLSSRPADSYFFELFPLVSQLIDTCQIETIIIAGDITQNKSGHSADLVNKIADGMALWAEKVYDIKILFGNHDGNTGNKPFWEFLGHI